MDKLSPLICKITDIIPDISNIIASYARMDSIIGKFMYKFGQYGKGNGQLLNPTNIAVGKTSLTGQDEVFVTDLNNDRIQVFSRDGKMLRKWGKTGNKNGQFHYPSGIALSSRVAAVEVYVCDTGNHRIQVFTSDGQFLRKFLDGVLDEPTQIAVNDSCKSGTEVYVADRNNCYIRVFTYDGKCIRKWNTCTTNSIFIGPSGLALVAGRRQVEVFIADAINNWVQVFTSEGRFLRKFGSSDGKRGRSNGKFSYPCGIAVGPACDEVYVIDVLNHRVQVFTLEGIFLRTWGQFGESEAYFNFPRCVAVGKNNLLYISDYHNHRVQVFS